MSKRAIQIGDRTKKIYFNTSASPYPSGTLLFDNNRHIECVTSGDSTILGYYENNVMVQQIYIFSVAPMNVENINSRADWSEWTVTELTVSTPLKVLDVPSDFTALVSIETSELEKEPAVLRTVTPVEKPSLSLNNNSLINLVNKVSDTNNYIDYLRKRIINSCNFFNEELAPKLGNPKINLTISALSMGGTPGATLINFIGKNTGKTLFSYNCSNVTSITGMATGLSSGGRLIFKSSIPIEEECTITIDYKSSSPWFDTDLYVNGNKEHRFTPNSLSSSYVIKPNDDVLIFIAGFSCLAKGTKITLANNTYKNIEDITYDDEILVWNFDEGKFDSAKPLWIKKAESCPRYNLLKFSDGSELKTIDQHRIFNKQKGMFTYPMTDDTPIGTITFNEKGEEVTLISKEVITEEVEYYNVITDYHINLFGNGILTSCRYNNIYPIQDMKFIKDNKDNKEYMCNEIPCKYINGLRLSEQSFTVDENIKYIKNLIRLKKQSEGRK